MLSPRLNTRVPWLATVRAARRSPLSAMRPSTTWMGAESDQAPSTTSAQRCGASNSPGSRGK